MQLFQLLNFIFPRDPMMTTMMIYSPNHMRGGIIFQKEILRSQQNWRTDQGRKVKSRKEVGTEVERVSDWSIFRIGPNCVRFSKIPFGPKPTIFTKN